MGGRCLPIREESGYDLKLNAIQYPMQPTARKSRGEQPCWDAPTYWVYVGGLCGLPGNWCLGNQCLAGTPLEHVPHMLPRFASHIPDALP